MWVILNAGHPMRMRWAEARHGPIVGFAVVPELNHALVTCKSTTQKQYIKRHENEKNKTTMFARRCTSATEIVRSVRVEINVANAIGISFRNAPNALLFAHIKCNNGGAKTDSHQR